MNRMTLGVFARRSEELTAGTGITVNSVLPGPTRSEGVEEFVGKLSEGKPFEEFGKEFFEKVCPPTYSMSKAALNSLMQHFAAALPQFAVNAVSPGWVRTDMGDRAARRRAGRGYHRLARARCAAIADPEISPRTPGDRVVTSICSPRSFYAKHGMCPHLPGSGRFHLAAIPRTRRRQPLRPTTEKLFAVGGK